MSGSLNARLAEKRATAEAKRPPELVDTMNRATEALRDSGILDGVPGVGDRAPLFARPNLEGSTVRLASLLRRGPVILSFFRGRW